MAESPALLAARMSSAGRSVPSEAVEWVCRSMRWCMVRLVSPYGWATDSLGASIGGIVCRVKGRRDLCAGAASAMIGEFDEERKEVRPWTRSCCSCWPVPNVGGSWLFCPRAMDCPARAAGWFIPCARAFRWCWSRRPCPWPSGRTPRAKSSAVPGGLARAAVLP